MTNDQTLEIDLWKKDFTKRVTIPLSFGVTKTFRNLKEIKSWMEDERKYCSTVFDSRLSNKFNTYQAMNQAYANILQIIEQEYNSLNRNKPEAISSWDTLDLNRIKSLISQQYSSMVLIASESKEAVYLKQLKEKDSTLVETAFRYLSNKANDTSEISAKAMISVFEYEHGIVDIRNAERDQVFSILEELKAEKDCYLQEITLLRNETQKLKDDIEILKSESESEQEFSSELSRHKSQMSDSEEFYEKKLAVKSSVDYWVVKAKNHRVVACVFAFLSLLIMGLCIYYASNSFNLIVTGEFHSKTPIFTDEGALQLWVYALLGIIATITFWVLRLFVRIALSNLHLSTDADERATMIKTYLAFEREDGILDKDDKALILPTIFRAGSTGIVKDDSAPINPWTLLTRK